jgi:uncharacterized protein
MQLDLQKNHKYNVCMITFEWDETKAVANLKKHKVSFEEAKSIFFDDFGVQFFDDDHSSDEERFLMLGMSVSAKLLIVCHCERDQSAVIRIISARKATKRESAFYRGGHA